jgi:hypothetical protein
MKKFTVRAFVLTLALAGFAASNAATTKHKVSSFSDPTGPTPMCLPSSGQVCGLD